MKITKNSIQFFLLILATVFSTSCATTVGMTAAAVTGAAISVGAAIITAPFKIIGAVGRDDDDETEDNN
ncbi:MAG: hypothetical protein COA71_14355 [SAR86 cluster bacterium]|uniref:Lipoprotein n=1 Tax=SAR86 cluster bacterium TaxID=2030880 RepID=A0A2A5C662_9GAMM|nr:hypothetical protein [bacterium AH-315-I11]PCJ39297.1 MAG: hypothetical protein COA71_14355 [SAR86 cluster bacterium]